MTPRQALVARVAQVVVDTFGSGVLHGMHVVGPLNADPQVKDRTFCPTSLLVSDVLKAAQQLRLTAAIRGLAK